MFVFTMVVMHAVVELSGRLQNRAERLQRPQSEHHHAVPPLPTQDFFARHDIPNDIRKRVVTQMLARHTNRRMMRDELLLRDMTPSMRVRKGGCNIVFWQELGSQWKPVPPAGA